MKFCASLGYLKGEVSVRDVLSARYGGARFQLVDPDEGESYYYEAVIAAQDPASAQEAKAKLETLARKFKLPLWTDAEMHSFLTQLGKRADYPDDFSVDGPEHFREKFGA